MKGIASSNKFSSVQFVIEINIKFLRRCSAPVWAALISVVCHEFPLMTMIMFLPAYLVIIIQQNVPTSFMRSVLFSFVMQLFAFFLISAYYFSNLPLKAIFGESSFSKE